MLTYVYQELVTGCNVYLMNDVCSRMLTYADVCSRMLTYADVCSRMLTYAPTGAATRYPELAIDFLVSIRRFRPVAFVGNKNVPLALIHALFGQQVGHIRVPPVCV